jgi:uncharacterized protein YcfJ
MGGLALWAAAMAVPAHADVTFYEHRDFEGRSFSSPHGVADFRRFGFNDQASSVVVTGEAWEVCEHVEFQGQCMVLVPGHYRSLQDMGMNNRLSSARPARRDAPYGEDRYAPRPVDGEISFFEHSGFQGRAIRATGEIPDLGRYGFNDRASSVIVLGERWEACEHAGFGGRCVILRPGRYPSLGAMGLNDRLSSVRPVHPTVRFDDARYAPMPQPVYDWRRRPQERLYEASVIGANAVYATPQQRCWVERDRVVREPNAAGAVVGGVIGGILGHQIGGGGGRDAATALGVLGGAVVGANVGRDSSGQQTYTQDVQRCDRPVGQVRPDYWDVTYVFRGREFHVQMVAPPGPTVTVNSEGEPRV